jgi:ribosomal protein S18 acetylase RimI-like enzyme
VVQTWGEAWLVELEEWPAPPGTRVLKTAPLVQMVAENPASLEPDDKIVEPLGEADVESMTELALATEPGHWSLWTHRYGPFYGIRAEGRLASMAGERMRPAAGWSELSAVCTWPEYRGRGYAARVIRWVMAGFTARGDLPFLHSYSGNTGAIALYERLGFRTRRLMTLTVLVKA